MKQRSEGTRLRYDTVLKDLFQQTPSSLIHDWTGGVRVSQLLNVELPIVQYRLADMAMLLEDQTILHVDFQSTNHPRMAHRMGIYGLLLSEKYRRKKIRQVVLYVGERPMRMPRALDLGDIRVSYRLMDIREMSAEALLARGTPADCALALLAEGGTGRIREIIRAGARLDPAHRQDVFTRMLVLAGLRGTSERLTMEMDAMGVYVDLDKNPALKGAMERNRNKGREEGLEQGRRVLADALTSLMEKRFGRLPKWAVTRIEKASIAELEKWFALALSGANVESVLGRR